MLTPVPNATELPLIQFIKENRIKSSCLFFSYGYIDEMDVLPLFKACGASKVSVGKVLPNVFMGGPDVPFPFDIIRQLAAAVSLLAYKRHPKPRFYQTRQLFRGVKK